MHVPEVRIVSQWWPIHWLILVGKDIIGPPSSCSPIWEICFHTSLCFKKNWPTYGIALRWKQQTLSLTQFCTLNLAPKQVSHQLFAPYLNTKDFLFDVNLQSYLDKESFTKGFMDTMQTTLKGIVIQLVGPNQLVGMEFSMYKTHLAIVNI